MTGHEVESVLGIPKTEIWKLLLKKLGMTRVCEKFISKISPAGAEILYYVEVLKIMRDALRRKGPHFWSSID